MEIDLKTWKHGSQRAPHKPLLLLYALGRWVNGQREYKWLRVKKDVGALIEQFGGNAKVEVSNPFTRLRKDLNGELWEIDGELVLGASDNPSVKSLNLINNSVTDISALMNLIQLENLYLADTTTSVNQWGSGNNISDSQKTILESALPNTTISW